MGRHSDPCQIAPTLPLELHRSVGGRGRLIGLELFATDLPSRELLRAGSEIDLPPPPDAPAGTTRAK